MSHSVTATINAGIGASLKGDNIEGSAPSFSLPALADISFTNGTGASKANALYAVDQVVPASGNVTLDLSTALTDPVGKSFGFAKIRALQIESDAANSGAVTVGAAASNAFVGPLGGTTPTLAFLAGDRMVFVSKGVTGWTVDGTHKSLKLANAGGADATVRIAVLGESA